MSLINQIGDDIEELLSHVKDINGLGKEQERKTWQNWLSNQMCQPLKVCYPDSFDELAETIKEAESNVCKVKAVGSGHPDTDMTLTTDYLIITDYLNKELIINPDTLRVGTDIRNLVKVEAGIKIHDLIKLLDSKGKALINMGAATLQSLAGVISTSTHGSGITLDSFPGFIRSFIIVASGGKVYQIEPADGISNPDAFNDAYPKIELIQNNDWFNSAAVSMGAMGVIYAVTLEVTDRYFLTENRSMSSWSIVKANLQTGDVLRNNRHYEVLINPYKLDGDHQCLVTQRNYGIEPVIVLEKKKIRDYHEVFIAEIPDIDILMKTFFNLFPQHTPKIINWAMKQLVDDSYTNTSYKILDLGPTGRIKAYSIEMAFPMDKYIDAVEKIFNVADGNAKLGNIYQTSPFSLRFVKESRHYMSMQYKQATCMIEIPIVKGCVGGLEILTRLENELVDIGGRPHWGQGNHVSCHNDMIRKMYPMYDSWRTIYKILNSNGTFENEFTKRCGFD